MRRRSGLIALVAATWAMLGGQAYGLSLLPGGSSSATYTWQQINAMGHLNAHDGRLLAGCHMYAWSYSIHPPAGMNWEVDVYINGPGNTHLATAALMINADALNGVRYYRLCSAIAPKGTYTIVSVMNLWGSSGADQAAHLPVVHYTLN
jgi:hypothetical protein